MGNFNPNKQSVMGLADSLIQFFNKGIKANNIADNAIITSLLANESVTKEKIMQSSLKEWLESMFNESPVWFLPTGFPFYWPGSTPPDGAIEANGAELLRSDYQNLWTFANNSGNIVSETDWNADNQGAFSTGNGTTTFRIPDARGRGIIGTGQGSGLTYRTLGSVGGAENHVLLIAQMPSHHHGNIKFVNRYGGLANTPLTGTSSTEGHVNNTGATSVGGNEAHNNMQPWVAWLCCIKI